MRFGVRGRPQQQSAVEVDGPLVLAETCAGRCVHGLQRAVLRLVPGELFYLAPRLRVAMQLDEYEGVFLAGQAVVRRALEHGSEQYFRIEVHLAFNADAGEEPHRLDVIAVLQEIRANQGLFDVPLATEKLPCG